MAVRAGTVPTLTHSVIAPRPRPVLPIADGKGRPWLRGKPSNPCHMRHCPHLRGLRRNIPLCLSVRQPACLPDYGLQVCKPHSSPHLTLLYMIQLFVGVR